MWKVFVILFLAGKVKDIIVTLIILVSLKECFLLIWHSKYSVIYTPTDCFFGDFAHWVSASLLHYMVKRIFWLNWMIFSELYFFYGKYVTKQERWMHCYRGWFRHLCLRLCFKHLIYSAACFKCPAVCLKYAAG